MFVDAPFPAPTFYWRALTTVMSHYSSVAHTFCMLFMSQINLKMHINEQIIAKLYGEFKYEFIRRWVSNVLATNTWKVGYASILIFLSMHPGSTVGAAKGLVRKLEEGIDLDHNKYNTTFLGVLPPTIGLYFIRYKNKTTFIWCAVCGDHFVVGADHLLPPQTQWSPHTAHQTIAPSLKCIMICS